ncbi:MAG: type VI secretion system baseplate subunit TssE [Polyangiales bacterium]
MTEPARTTRLRPSLLDRLTDLHPERRLETTDEITVDEAGLREQVRRDLTWLFNTTHVEAGMDLNPYPHVKSSILNFGMTDLTGQQLSSIKADALAKSVRQALLTYEPRLLPSSIGIAVQLGKNPFGTAALIVEIEADLFSEPLPIALHLRTEIDVETGRVTVGDAASKKGK